MTGPIVPVAWPSLQDRRAGFDRMYSERPERFAGPPSRFCQWALPVLRTHFPWGQVVELGGGPGRDARALAAAGYQVWSTDASPVAIARARADADNPLRVRFDAIDALSALRQTLTESLDAVYAHALYMLLPEDELAALVPEVRRVLHPGGLHLFGVRSTTDPIASEGAEVAPDVRRRTPDSGPYRYFRPESIDRMTAQGFAREGFEFRSADHFYFVADRRV